MDKLTKPQRERLQEIMSMGGACQASSWTTGSGRFTKRRTSPPLSAEWQHSDLLSQKPVPRHVRAVFRKYPRTQIVLGVVSLAKARKALSA